MSKFFRLHQVRILLTALISSVFVFGNTQAIHAQNASSGTIVYSSSAYSPVEISITITNLESPKSPIHASSKIRVELLCKLKGTDLPKTVTNFRGKVFEIGPLFNVYCLAGFEQNDGFGKTFQWDTIEAKGEALFTSDEIYEYRSVATLKLVSTKPFILSYVSAEALDSKESSGLPLDNNRVGTNNVILIDGIKAAPSSNTSPKKSAKTPAPVKSTTKSNNSKVVKDGASCASAGKITNVSGVNLVCAKIGSKLVWVSLSSSGAKATPNPKPTPVASQSKSCSPNSSLVKSYIGADNNQGENLTALVFENLSECNLSVSAIASFICPDGGTLKPQNAIQSTGTFALSPKQKLLITQLSLSRYFPLLSQQCFQLTGFRTNIPPIDTFYGGSPRATVISSTP